MSTCGKSRRGFAPRDLAKRRVVANMGGKAAHARGTAHKFNSGEASAAGQKGGLAVQAKGTGRQFKPAEARKARRRGGLARPRREKTSREGEVGLYGIPAQSGRARPQNGTAAQGHISGKQGGSEDRRHWQWNPAGGMAKPQEGRFAGWGAYFLRQTPYLGEVPCTLSLSKAAAIVAGD
jgi:hypothetical protein